MDCILNTENTAALCPSPSRLLKTPTPALYLTFPRISLLQEQRRFPYKCLFLEIIFLVFQIHSKVFKFAFDIHIVQLIYKAQYYFVNIGFKVFQETSEKKSVLVQNS